MPELKGTKTEQNLWTAFAGESQARNKYTYYASKAKKDGYVQIAKLFAQTPSNGIKYSSPIFSFTQSLTKYLSASLVFIGVESYNFIH